MERCNELFDKTGENSGTLEGSDFGAFLAYFLSFRGLHVCLSFLVPISIVSTDADIKQLL